MSGRRRSMMTLHQDNNETQSIPASEFLIMSTAECCVPIPSLLLCESIPIHIRQTTSTWRIQSLPAACWSINIGLPVPNMANATSILRLLTVQMLSMLSILRMTQYRSNSLPPPHTNTYANTHIRTFNSLTIYLPSNSISDVNHTYCSCGSYCEIQYLDSLDGFDR